MRRYPQTISKINLLKSKRLNFLFFVKEELPLQFELKQKQSLPPADHNTSRL